MWKFLIKKYSRNYKRQLSNYSLQNLLYQKFRWTHGCTRFMYEGLEAIMVAGGRVNSREDALESVEILGRYFI